MTLSRLTDGFDAWCEILAANGHALELLDGAPEEEIVGAERQVGFTFAPEVRELYAHSNGLTVPGVGLLFLPPSMSFLQLENGHSYRSSFKNAPELASEDLQNPGVRGPGGVPLEVLAVFWGGEGTVAVECSEHAQGAVMFLNDDARFFWVARSLTELFERYVDAYEKGIIEWDDMGYPAVRRRYESKMVEYTSDEPPRGSCSVWHWDDWATGH
ncbi:MAG: SMI1/KNR4 family protein [Acidimicrobiia bacterium]|nr:SMI1/KNR4 family protein [Acidimicrobiia bacterium]